jgi:hypothetical protein
MTPSPSEMPRAGSGLVSFGRGYQPNTLKVIRPASSFKTTTTVMGWSASLDEPAGATSLTFALARRSSGGQEEVIARDRVPLVDPNVTIVANTADLALLADRQPGTYVVRLERGAIVLAQGTFRLVR